MKVFSYTTDKGSIQIGVEHQDELYNFSQMWEIYKQVENKGRGPSLDFLQIMVEAAFFSSATFEEVITTIQGIRPLNDLKLRQPYTFQPPIGRPQKILCIGRNYKSHADELGNKVPQEPIFFSKSPSAMIAHQQAIKLPREVGRIDHEGELAVVIGKQAHRISEKYATEFIAGYSLLNDVTARDLQKADIQERRPWFRSKSFDTFCPFGPFLVPRDSIKDVGDLTLEVKVNGERKQFASTNQMIFSVSEVVTYISKFCTLQPGDVIATGTPSGVGQLQQGDIVECQISEIGNLRNTVE